MICPECYYKNDADSNFCSKCGFKISNEIVINTKTEINNILFFDTETDGLIEDYNINESFEGFPRLVQIGWILLDFKNNEIIKKRSYIIKPIDYSISKESALIHGITTEIALSKGEDLQMILGYFYMDLLDSDIFVAHNLQFDKLIMEVYFKLHGYENVTAKIPSLCTMLLSANFCNLKEEGYSYIKYPTLFELHNKLFKRPSLHNNLHNALNDTLITYDCFMELMKQKVISKEKINYLNYLNKLTLNIYGYNDNLEKIISGDGDEIWDWKKRLRNKIRKKAMFFREQNSDKRHIEFFDSLSKRKIYSYNCLDGLITIFDWIDESVILKINTIERKVSFISLMLSEKINIKPYQLDDIEIDFGIQMLDNKIYIERRARPFLPIQELLEPTSKKIFKIWIDLKDCFVKFIRIEIGEIVFMEEWDYTEYENILNDSSSNRGVRYKKRKIIHSKDDNGNEMFSFWE
jgi:DNA polymerase-3 subunit epsilon